ncbi:cystathionine gamma-synthase [Pseudohyphozyma bogoriensis]|nr:cystathionine gamma-synthase [Pseudohyphozyma bogoriensis]
MSSFAVFAPPESPVGDCVPALTPHAVSVSLPKWDDNVDYEEGHPRIKAAMKQGYPRFYIHHLIDRLAQITKARFGQPDELCLLFLSQKVADSCRDFLLSRDPPVTSRHVVFPVKSSTTTTSTDPATLAKQRTVTIHAVFFAADDFPIAKQFWQHTGDGIQSRVAERCLILLGELDSEAAEQAASTTFTARAPSAGGGRYAAKTKRYAATPATASTSAAAIVGNVPASKSRYATAISSSLSRQPSGSEDSEPASLANSIESLTSPKLNGNGFAPVEQDEDVLSRYVEERYGRNLDLSLAPLAKIAMRRRIAGVLREAPGQAVPVEKIEKSKNEDSDRGVKGLTEGDVWLYPCGMSAIFHAHQLAMGVRKSQGKELGKSVCFGFPYTDTLKILEKWGPGCHFLGHGLSSDLPALRKICEEASPPILAVFCEFPSNPLLRSPPLAELRKLADEFGFLVVVDETIAGFVNVETLPKADIVVSSLTKVFSGDCNVMGGSLVINPSSPFYSSLKSVQEAEYEDNYFDEDAIYMERNSRDFQERIAHMNHNSETVCAFLRSRRAPGPVPRGMTPAPPSTYSNPVVREVFFPQFMTPENYEASMRKGNASDPNAKGYGSLFSVTFVSVAASKAFFDALACYKGPSLGTNFTIACPYTILAHYTELDWALDWGVDAGLVRISVGLEETDLLMSWIEKAMEAAEQAVAEEEAAKKA